METSGASEYVPSVDEVKVRELAGGVAAAVDNNDDQRQLRRPHDVEPAINT